MANLNYNKVSIGGRITKDIELKTTASGITNCSFTIAVNRAGAKEPTTDFINCVAWRTTAEFISKYFHKGSCIMIDGQLNVSSYEKDGNKIWQTNVVVDKAFFVDSKGKSDSVAEKSEPTFEPIGEDEELPF